MRTVTLLRRSGALALPTPRAPSRRLYDDPEVQALRDRLRANNGIKGLDICAPNEIDRAVRLFFRDGFVVVKDLLDAYALARWRGGCARELCKILEPDGHDGRKYITETMRLPHRYSYGTASASRQLLHDPVWASMIDLPATTPILKAIFGTDDYLVLGAGGDLCLPGAVEYQHLHGDVREQYHLPEARIRQAAGLGIDTSGELDGRTKPADRRANAARGHDQLLHERPHVGEWPHPPDSRYPRRGGRPAKACRRTRMDAPLDAGRRSRRRWRVPRQPCLAQRHAQPCHGKSAPFPTSSTVPRGSTATVPTPAPCRTKSGKRSPPTPSTCAAA